MSRYRPPPSPASAYITPEGADRLRAELDRLWRLERPQVTRAVAEAAAQGDRSENAEYTYGKRRLREIDRRVRHLRNRLQVAVVVNRPPTDPARVYFGAWVTLEAEDGEVRYRIVGPDEIDHEPGYISMDSPLGRALLGRRLGDAVSVQLPDGVRNVKITGIAYTAIP